MGTNFVAPAPKRMRTKWKDDWQEKKIFIKLDKRKHIKKYVHDIDEGRMLRRL